MKDALYFPHDSNSTNDPKIMMLIAKWGLEAYGIFWTIIEHLREQPKYISHLSILKGLAHRHGSTEEKYVYVVRDFDLFVIKGNEFFYSKSLKERMKPLDEKRLTMRHKALTRWHGKDLADAYALPTQSKSNTSKVKESKVNKVKESIVEYSENFKNQLLSEQVYCEKIMMVNRVDINSLKFHLDQFNLSNSKHTNYLEYRDHFANWLKIQLAKPENAPVQKGKTNAEWNKIIKEEEERQKIQKLNSTKQ